MNSIILKPAPRHQSLMTQLSSWMWDWGLSTFYMERLPFSGRNNKAFADKLCDFYLELVKTRFTERSIYHIYDLGAGLGLLSKHFLDQLKLKAPDIYQKTTVHVTDSNKIMIQQLQEISLFYEHAERIQFTVCDAINFTVNPKEQPVLIYSSYLLSSFPITHIERQNPDQNFDCYEIQLESKITAPILDTTCYPPRLLSADKINALISGSDTKRKKALAPRVKSHVTENPVTIPIQKSSLSQTDRDELQSFLKEHPTAEPIRFNYPQHLSTHIKHILTALAPDGVYFASDFGAFQLRLTPLQELTDHYDAVICHYLCFPFLKWSATHNYCHIAHTTHKTHTTQEFLLYPGTKNPAIEGHFHHFFNNNTSTNQVSKLVQYINKNLDKSTKIDLNELKGKINTLSEIEQQDYVLLKQTAGYAFKQGEIAEAFKYALKLHENYGEIAIDAALIMGWCCQNIGSHEEALSCFEQANYLCKNDTTIYSSWCLSFFGLKQFKEALKALKQALYYTRDIESLWSTAHGIYLTELHLGNKEKAKEAIAWLYEISKTHPEYLPPKIQKQFETRMSKV